MRGLNLGSGPTWRRDGWDVLDHSIVTKPWKLRSQAWHLPYTDETYDQVFSSHMIEHISNMKIEQTICEINRVMKNGGILRILTPDLKKIAAAYVNGDTKTMAKYIDEDRSGISMRLGLGGALMNFILSVGYDNLMLSSDYSEVVGSYAHVYCYDFEMLAKILEYYGFIVDSEKSHIDRSSIPEHKDLREVPYNVDAGHSLVIECRKERYIPFKPVSSIFCYGPYKREWLIPTRKGPTRLLFKSIGYVWVTLLWIKNLVTK